MELSKSRRLFDLNVKFITCQNHAPKKNYEKIYSSIFFIIKSNK